MNNTIPFKPSRVASIDVFRALTMLIMIFVNDLWSVIDAPHWLKHAAGSEDMLGFSDVVFPAFLVVMGMSIPLAIEARLQKGGTKFDILESIAKRTFALIVIGLVLVNTEYGLSSEMIVSPNIYKLLMLVGFLLVWNLYPKTGAMSSINMQRILKAIGSALLLFLIFIYRDGAGEMFQERWWGILGLIGWAYAFCAVIYLYNRLQPLMLLVFYGLFVLLCIFGNNDWLGAFSGLIPDNGCHHAFTMTGVITTLILQHSKLKFDIKKRLMIVAGVGVGMLALGFISHNFWIISKIQATPTWLFFCSGISLLLYVFFYWLTDIKGKASWFAIISTAGTATLTCYLMPYLLYTLMNMVGLQLPEAILVSPIGLVKCLVFAFITIGATALIGKAGIKLKI